MAEAPSAPTTFVPGNLGGTNPETPSADSRWPALTSGRAEGVGFEPTVDETAHNGFRDRCDRPRIPRSRAKFSSSRWPAGKASGKPNASHPVEHPSTCDDDNAANHRP